MEKQALSAIREKALKQFKEGKSLFGKDGAFAPLFKDFLEQALEAEMEAHLDAQARKAGNKRNGKGQKTIKSSTGNFVIKTPYDRHSKFDPVMVKKRETILADTFEEKIIGLYGLGMSDRDIKKYLAEMYDTEVSHTFISQVTDRIIPKVKEWQNRPLETVYPIVFLDAMHHKVREDSVIKSKALYSTLGVNQEGRKEILGLYIGESEGAKFWLQVLTNLKNRGVEDVLIICTDNLKGFPEAIASVYPKAEIQTCIIHQIRNSCKYVASKNRKEFMTDLKKYIKQTHKH